MEKRRSSKRELVEGMLDAGMAMVTLDARAPGVDVPSRFRDDPHLALNLSYRFGRSLRLEEWGIEASLTFGGVPYLCRLPWSSIYQAYSHVTGEQLIFPADLPMDLIEALELQRSEEPSGDAPADEARLRQEDDGSSAQVVGDGEALPRAEEAPLSEEEKKEALYRIIFGKERPPEPPTLRVVDGGVSQPLESEPEPTEKPARPSHLRLVK